MNFKHTFESRVLTSPANSDLHMFIHAELEVDGKLMHLTLTGEHGDKLIERLLPEVDRVMIDKWVSECRQDYESYRVDMATDICRSFLEDMGRENVG
jgi:hypothetical protein